MAPPPQLRVLFFDVFGTCVTQRPALADELWRAAREALNSPSITPEVRSRAMKMTYGRWFEFGGEWNKDIDEFTKQSIAEHNNVDWMAVDRYRPVSLRKLLVNLDLVTPSENTASSNLGVQDGSLWDESELKQISLIWQRLPPWPDTCDGLDLLNKRFTTVTLSNTYKELMESLVAHSSIPFKHVYTSDMFDSYKPNPKVYLGAAEKMGVKPEECGLVAAHLSDLKGAKSCGFHAIYVERPLEEKMPALREENIPDLTIEESENGFVALAERLGISTS